MVFASEAFSQQRRGQIFAHFFDLVRPPKYHGIGCGNDFLDKFDFEPVGLTFEGQEINSREN
jgi:hypothetical protein